MTILVKTYGSRENYEADRTAQHRADFRALHIDEGFVVTWVKGTDDPTNTPIPKRQLTESQYIREQASNDNVKIIP